MTTDQPISQDSAPDSRQSSPLRDAFFGLPHRPPFVFIREVGRVEAGIFAECATVFPADDPMFKGHFPDNPLVPGVILTEALAQTAGIAAASGYAEGTRPRFLLSAIRQMKFPGAAGPEERITLRATRLGQVDQLFQFQVEALVNERQVAVGQIVLSAANHGQADFLPANHANERE